MFTINIHIIKGFPGGLDSKESACNMGDPGSIIVRKIPWRRKCLPTPVLLPGKPHGQRSLAGYSPRDRKDSDLTEWLTLHYYICYKGQINNILKIFYLSLKNVVLFSFQCVLTASSENEYASHM